MVDYSNIPRDSRRVPLETRVQFKFDRFDGFISEYSANISPGGMFIRTRVPQPPGTVLDFEFRLGDGFELIRGRGEVVWNRLEDEGPARPGGMGLHFLELAEGSRELIYRIVDQHVALGGTPFDLEQRPWDPVPAAPPDLSPPLSAATPWPRPAPPPPPLPPLSPPVNRDVFDLPRVTPAPAPIPEPSSWLPPLDEPGPGVSSLDEPFPDLFSPPESPAAAPPMFAPTFGHASVRRQPRRVLPLALLAAGLLLAVVLFLLRDRLMGWVGLGGEEETVAQTAPPRRPKTAPPARAAAPVAVPDSGTSDSALPEAATPPTAAPARVTGGAAPGAPASAIPGTPAPAAPPPARPPVAPFPAVAEDSGPALTAVDKITFEAAGGGTDVILWGNGAIPASVYTQSRLDGNPPRELFRLSGIRQQFAKARLVVGTPEVLQIRTGLHAGGRGSELHVVLDLAHPNVTVTQVESGPHRLRIHLQKK
jgi:molecular chaperone DnaK